MFGGAIACALICVLIVYIVTTTGNTAYEFFVYVFVLFGFMLAIGGYLIEERYKKEHPEEYMQDILDS